jgi:RNA polymerase sigma-70 factor (ECF subfamily)
MDTLKTHELRTLLVPFISKRVAPQDVDDVLQNVFVRIQRGLGGLRDGEKLVEWGYQIARNVIIDHARRVAVRTHDSLDQVGTVAATDPDEDASGELALILGHFIEMLPEPYREALELTDLRGLTRAEAAERVGLSLPGMKSRVQRGRVQLRALLEACCDIELDTRGSIIDVEPRNRPASLPDCCSRDRASFEADVRLPNMANEQTQNTEASTPKTSEQSTGCCGGPAPAESGACCVKDAVAKAAGESGCGCNSAPRVSSRCC